MFVGNVAQQHFGVFTTETSNGDGRVAVRVQFGTTAGPGRIEITVPEFGLADTAAFTITPGQSASVRIFPPDTAVFVKATVQLTANAVDRFQNPRSDPPVMYSLLSQPVGAGSVSQTGLVATSSPGRLVVIAAAGPGARDTAYVSVIPRGTIAAPDYLISRLIVIDLDGSNRHVVGPFPIHSSLEPAWSPDGVELLVAPTSVSREFQRVRLNGPTLVQTVGAGALDPYWPSYSPDGQFVYFTSGGDGVIWRARPDGSSAESASIPATFTQYRPSISRDSRYLALHTIAQSGIEVVVQVWDLQTRTKVSGDIPGRFPEWSPASDSVAYLENGTGHLLLMHRNGTGIRLVRPPGGPLLIDGQISWSPDGRWILARSEAGLELIEVPTGLRLPLRLGDLVHPAWRPGS
jgi:Tol biopolymer transport system component